ncbi:hypothetical protein OP10G_0974 [Fimbriimonas ginsengisoli Gsoil 348]|uniref:Uncharacterized protein n=1 Tax=Fimbriimonas ginsengisoli Gsoil 348 TaxID=661478 RepID=A0A068NLQ0_FIMGI|nr:hypothetical protein OP10G_0974 [Fimbriimonas ginsengisoli Gsoil 348]
MSGNIGFDCGHQRFRSGFLVAVGSATACRGRGGVSAPYPGSSTRG